MEELLEFGLDLALKSGANFAEIRAVDTEEKIIRFENGAVACSQHSHTPGFSIRVLVAGRWGFASSPQGGKTVIKRLVTTALAGAEFEPRPGRPSRLSACFPVQDQWQSPWELDPFAIPGAELVELLGEADAAMDIAGISQRVSFVNFRRDHSQYMNSEGTRTTQTTTLSGGGVSAWAVADNEILQRSWPCPGGSYAEGGYEYIQELDLPKNAGRMAREAVALIKAPPCPEGVTDLVLSGSMLAAQVQYTCGHRAQLGTPGFFPPDRAGHIRFGSPLLTISADATWPGGAGSFGYDQEGVKAQTFDIVREGKFINHFTGRDHAASIGRFSSGAMRTGSWLHPPTPRMTNLILQPGKSSLTELVAGIERGIALDTIHTFGTSPNFQGFVTKAETGWLIEKGKLTQMVRGPVCKGWSTAFWSGCDAVAGPEHQEVLGLMDDGIAVGYKVVPVRIRGVKVGVNQ